MAISVKKSRFFEIRGRGTLVMGVSVFRSCGGRSLTNFGTCWSVDFVFITITTWDWNTMVTSWNKSSRKLENQFHAKSEWHNNWLKVFFRQINCLVKQNRWFHEFFHKFPWSQRTREYIMRWFHGICKKWWEKIYEIFTLCVRTLLRSRFAFGIVQHLILSTSLPLIKVQIAISIVRPSMIRVIRGSVIIGRFKNCQRVRGFVKGRTRSGQSMIIWFLIGIDFKVGLSIVNSHFLNAILDSGNLQNTVLWKRIKKLREIVPF